MQRTVSAAARRRALPAIVLGLLAASFAGCGFFDTRDPIEVEPVEIPRRPPTSPQNVMFNHWNAIRFGLQGQTQFEETLDEEFRFTLDLADSLELDLGSIDLDQTISAYQRAVENFDSLFFAFDEERVEEPDEQQGNEAFYNRIPYEGALLEVQPDTVIVLEAFQGEADIRLRTDLSNNWVIRTWEDFAAGAAGLTWGRILGDRVTPGAPAGRATLD